MATDARDSLPRQYPTTIKTWERCIIIEEGRVIKRELRKEEFSRNLSGEVMQPFWARERLINEAASIQFVASQTNIPVPTCRFYDDEDGIAHLETARIRNGVLLDDLAEQSRPTAIQVVNKEIEDVILPQLRSRRRNFIGSVDTNLPVFPPQRVYERDRRPWPQITSDSDCFVLCHNDLGPQNIFVNPDTFKIVGIIDWEFSGFYPPYFELPLWRVVDRKDRQNMYAAAETRELDFFGLKPGDLQDCLTLQS
ncbi:uncharacterized protein PG998_014457 [Apiospora kogelbergensis]|uniref:uncharacterized protein n=1 Tax=Apiospora kogelbergensis TaxID=1337665 RepID=UPI00312F6030